MIKIYIASPYTVGNKEDNVNLQIDVAQELLSRGYAPFIPLMNHYFQLRHPHHENDWLKLDFVYLSVCDVLIRIKPTVDGVEVPSTGASQEEQFALDNEIPVFSFNTIKEMCLWLDENPFTEDN